jgi:hypothetical protein
VYLFSVVPTNTERYSGAPPDCDAAYVYGRENQLGSIETGKVADMVRLSEDPLSMGSQSRLVKDSQNHRHRASRSAAPQSKRGTSADLAGLRASWAGSGAPGFKLGVA